MKARDRRPRILSAVLWDTELTAHEKLYLLTVTMLKAECFDGKRRFGSKAMGPDGMFSLHVDYIAEQMGAGGHQVVTRARRGCESKGWLTQVHKATHGRPACYQALVNGRISQSVRVSNYYRVEGVENRHPYEQTDPPVRVSKTDTLTYRGGTQPHHDGSRPSLSPPGRNAAMRTDAPRPGAKPRVCAWHVDTECPPDCRGAAAS